MRKLVDDACRETVVWGRDQADKRHANRVEILTKNKVEIIDLGPEGGDEGGHIVVAGTPEEVARQAKSYTGQHLKKALHLPARNGKRKAG